MKSKRETFVDKLLGGMTLAEKVGQCFTLSWRGSMITPSAVDVITKLNAGGLRIEPYTTESATALYYGRRLAEKGFDLPEEYRHIAQTYFKAKHPGTYTPPDEYARRLNRLKEIAMNRRSGIPLHITLDYEGDFSHDYAFGGMNLFPSHMGLAACGDDDLVYRAAKAVARQLHAIGVTMMHSPICDVNVNPDNPEIGTRSFSDDAKTCARLVVRQLEGIRDGGLVAVAKHYPGRGNSSTDAHDGLPVIGDDGKTMRERDLLPYRALIAAGLGGVMTAHTNYPKLDPAGVPATLSRIIVHDILRGELGFTGVITSDAMGMGAIVNTWGVPRACVLALKAGCDLVLVKNDEEVRAQSVCEVTRAVQSGEIAEADLDASVRRILLMKYDQGLFKNGGMVDADKAPGIIAQPAMRSVCRAAAEGCLILMRDDARLLPLSPDRKVLVIEQMVPAEFTPNDIHCNSHLFNEAMTAQSMNVINATTEFSATEQEQALMLEVAKEADVVVATNFYWRILPRNNTELIRRLVAAGKKVVVVANAPYASSCPREAPTVLCTFSGVPNSLRAAAEFLYGGRAARGIWPIRAQKPWDGAA
ncbi:hypothetical protein GX586_13430 [bacterium]|nr:hypothetical protein [bacterium]